MDPDIVFVVGFVISVFSIPAIVSAFSDGRSPRIATIIVLIGALMVGYAINERPGAYNFETFGDVLVGVIGRILN
jgi:uncharacterized membrane protein